jgi:hypothetical protein
MTPHLLVACGGEFLTDSRKPPQGLKAPVYCCGGGTAEEVAEKGFLSAHGEPQRLKAALIRRQLRHDRGRALPESFPAKEFFRNL